MFPLLSGGIICSIIIRSHDKFVSWQDPYSEKKEYTVSEQISYPNTKNPIVARANLDKLLTTPPY